MKRLFWFIWLFLLFGISVSAYAAEASKVIHRTDYAGKQDSLRHLYGANKQYPAEYEEEILIALSHFPDLQNVQIQFRARILPTTMAARPRPDAIFMPKNARTYRILLNNKTGDGSTINYDSLPFNARIGIIGHELAHIADYEQKSMVRILSNGLAYLFSSNFRRNLETEVDKIVISRGLGWQLYDFAHYVHNRAVVKKSYLSFKEEYYPSLEQYRRWLAEHPGMYQVEEAKNIPFY